MMAAEQTDVSRFLQGIVTTADAHARILAHLEEITELNKDIEYYQGLADEGQGGYRECAVARNNAIMDRNFARDAVKYLEHWIKIETRREWDERTAEKHRRELTQQQQRDQTKIVIKDERRDERSVNLALKRASLEAAQLKNKERLLVIERAQKALCLVESVEAAGIGLLLSQAASLLVALSRDKRVIYSPEENALIDALFEFTQKPKPTPKA